GQSLTVDPGTWTGTPTFAYQWQRCDASGANCADIASATAQSYLLTVADVAGTVQAVVTASNAGGPVTATSNVSAVIAAASDTTPPVFSGVPTLPLTYEANSASGSSPNYTLPTAVDAVDGPVPVTCTPASGAPMALGSTTVSCSAHDAALNQVTATFT